MSDQAEREKTQKLLDEEFLDCAKCEQLWPKKHLGTKCPDCCEEGKTPSLERIEAIIASGGFLQ